MKNKDSVIIKHQKVNLKKSISYYGESCTLYVSIRFDDQCGNGHNSFSITGEVFKAKTKNDRNHRVSGCIHEIILEHFPELTEAVALHHVSSEGPMHYVANSLYYASSKDSNGYEKGEACMWETKIKFDGFHMFFGAKKGVLIEREGFR